MTILKKQAIVFAIIAILMAMPFAGSSAFGASVEATANLGKVCGLVSGQPVELGVFYPGLVGEEAEFTISQSSDTNAPFNVLIGGSNWVGGTASATGTITLSSAVVGNMVTVNGLEYTGIAGSKGNDNTKFSIDTSNTAAATDLADSIAKDVRTGITVPALDVTATSSETIITVTAATPGIIGNGITMAKTGELIVLSGDNLEGGLDADGLIHLDSNVTKFSASFDGTTALTGGDNDLQKYGAKTAIGSTESPKPMGTTEYTLGDDPRDIHVAIQITGDGTLQNLPYLGPLTQTLTLTASCS